MSLKAESSISSQESMEALLIEINARSGEPRGHAEGFRRAHGKWIEVGFGKFDAEGEEYELFVEEMNKLRAVAPSKDNRAQFIHHMMARERDQICFVTASPRGIIYAARLRGCKSICSILRSMLNDIWGKCFAWARVAASCFHGRSTWICAE